MNSEHSLHHIVPPLEAEIRADRYVSETLSLFPRSQLEKRNLKMSLKGKTIKPSFKLIGGEELQIVWQDLPEVSFEAENIPLDVIWENDDVLVVNKARGMVVHPANGNWSGTLVQALLFRVEGLKEEFETSDNDDDVRPGIVHRLDKDTSGLIIAAKNATALEFLSKQFRERTTKKVYWAVLKGAMKSKRGRIETWLGRDPQNRQRFRVTADGVGKHAETLWRVLVEVPGFCLVEFEPKTGRTHQLRVHAAHIQHPIWGDPIYSRRSGDELVAPLMLHARRLTITIPGEEKSQVFTAPIPPDFLQTLRSLGFPDPQSFEPS